MPGWPTRKKIESSADEALLRADIYRRRFGLELLVIAAVLGGAAVAAITLKAPILLVAFVLAPAGVVLGQLCFQKRELVFLIAVLWVYIQYWLTRDIKILPGAGVWGDEACLGGLVFGAMLRNAARGRWAIRTAPGATPILIFVALGVASGLMNKVSPLHMVLGLRGLLQGFLFYIVIIQFPYNEGFMRRIMKMLRYICALQLPLALFQYATWNPAKGYMHEDSAFGTFGFGTANLLGWLYLGMSFHFVFSVGAGVLNRRWGLIAAASTGFNLLLSSSRVALMFSAPIMVMMIMKAPIPFQKKLTTLSAAGVAGVLLISAAGMLFEEMLPTDAESINTVIENQTENKSGGGRVWYYLDTLAVVNRNSALPAIGVGPGAYASFAGFTIKAPLLKQRLGHKIDDPGTSFAPDVTPVTGEFGWFGLLIFYWLLIRIYRRNEDTLTHIKDPFWGAMAKTVRVFALIMLIAPLTNSVWQAQFISGTYWLLAGMVDSHRQQVLKLK